MKTLRTPSYILGFLYLCFVGYLIFSTWQLPERVATHFNAGGQPDGWMSRFSHLLIMAVFGFAFPLFFVGLFFGLRFVPDALNVSNRDYWLAPERRIETFDYLFRQGLWRACMAVCFVTGLHYMIIHANFQPNADLSIPMLLAVPGFFLVGIVIWLISTIRYFTLRPSIEKTQA
jgi:uncharacterized membrane protein